MMFLGIRSLFSRSWREQYALVCWPTFYTSARGLCSDFLTQWWQHSTKAQVSAAGHLGLKSCSCFDPLQIFSQGSKQKFNLYLFSKLICQVAATVNMLIFKYQTSHLWETSRKLNESPLHKYSTSTDLFSKMSLLKMTWFDFPPSCKVGARSFHSDRKICNKW